MSGSRRPRRRDPDTSSRRGFSPIPRMPRQRDPHLVLDEIPGETGLLLWRLLTDLETWGHAPGEALFQPTSDAARLLETAPVPIRTPVHRITGIWHPAQTSVDEVADACGEVWAWAEQHDLREVALQFAEVAARLQPGRSDRSSTAGRICRLRSEPHRGTMWFRRALRIAQARMDYVEIAIAHLGLGNIASALARTTIAETHQYKAVRAALRAGKRSLAGSAYHDLLLLKTRMQRYDEAWMHARDALSAYKRDHPRFPLLAHDIALLWMHLGHFSAAHLVFERVLALLKRPSDRMVVLANVARSAAACGDRLRYERAVREIIRHLEAGGAATVFTRYYLAQAARTAGDWERAEYAVGKTLEAAPEGEYRRRAEQLAQDIAARLPGDEDVLPEEGGEIEQVREVLLRRLEKHAAPGTDPGTVPPEQYPIT